MAITMEELRRKARAYDEALEKAKRLYEKGTITECLCHIFPELKESEDEKIRKLLIRLFTSNTNEKFDDVSTQEIIAWLEKQGEKLGQQEVTKISDQVKDSDWSEEDAQHIDSLLKRLDGLCRNEFERTRFAINEDIDWLKALKDRVGCEANCTTTKEWGEEDEIYFQGIMNEIKANKHEAPDYDIPIYNRFLYWLESIKQRIGG